MPLMTLKSDLAWYKNPGWTPNPNVQTSDFQYNADLTATAIPRGFDQAGHQVSFIPRTSQDAYPIDTALGPNGSAKRKAQRGNGSLFPIGPNGQVHVFDTKRTGWYNEDRYGDTFSSKTLTGLAATYTANSPIDDVYNKFKVRDEVYDPYGYAKTPYILRGIQRDDNSDPQRWGLGDTTAGVVSGLLDIPRGGPLTAGDRIASDVARIGKFLIRPKGLAFIAKQQLLRLMSPNVEGISGSVYKLNPQKIYNPVNTLLSVAGASLGLRFRNYGLLPVGGVSRYEDIHKAREIAQLSIRGNRLARLNNQRTGDRISQVIPTWNALTGYTGPDSVGGFGFTDFKKNNAYDTYRTNDIQLAAILDDLTAEYDRFNPYVKSRNGVTAPGAFNPQQSVDGRDRLSLLATYRKNSLFTLGTRFYVSLAIPKDKTRFPIGNSIDTQLTFHDNNINNYGDNIAIRLRTTSYSQPYIGDRNNDDKIVNDIKTLTALDDAESKLIGSLKAKIDPRTFTGIPAKAPNPAKAEDTTPAIAKYKTLSYSQLPNDSRRSRPRLESRYGYKSYSVTDKRNGNPAGPIVSQPDPINSIPIGNNYSDDLIKFSFTPIKATTLDNANGNIIFRAYLTDLGDNFAPSWDSVQDQGRADAKVRYASFERSIDLGFKVVVHSAAERRIVWNKLSELAKITYPAYGDGGFYGVYVKVTIGDLYVRQPMYITSLSYMWDTETPWEIDDGQQLPMYTDVNMSLTWIGEKRPDYASAKVFSYR